MKKNYNVPATEVIAFVGDSMIMAGSPGGGSGEGGGSYDPTAPADPNAANIP